MENSLLVGIDIGASKTKVLVTTGQDKKITTLTFEGKNYRESDIQHYSVYISEIIKRIEFKFPKNYLNICIGIAGCGELETLKEIERILQNTFYKHTFVCLPDSYIAFEDCNEIQKNPILLILGTGSVILAKKENRFIQIGGWGYLFDQTNGSSSLGLEAIKYLTEIIDGKYSDPIYFDAYSEFFNSINLTESVKSIYQNSSIQQSLAAACYPLLELWKQNHFQSVQMIETFIKKVSINIRNIANKCYSEESSTLYISGGLINHNPDLKSILEKYLPKSILISDRKIAPERGAIKRLIRENHE